MSGSSFLGLAAPQTHFPSFFTPQRYTCDELVGFFAAAAAAVVLVMVPITIEQVSSVKSPPLKLLILEAELCILWKPVDGRDVFADFFSQLVVSKQVSNVISEFFLGEKNPPS